MRVIPAGGQRLLVESTPGLKAGATRLELGGTKGTYRVEHLFPGRRAALDLGKTWLMATAGRADARTHPWDLAHQFVSEGKALRSALALEEEPYAEPDLLQQFPYESTPYRAGVSFDSRRACQVNPLDTD